MPVETHLGEADDRFPLTARDLKEGEMYRDNTGDFVLVLENNTETEIVKTAVFSEAIDNKWFAYEYPHTGNDTFAGPYRAEIKVYGVAYEETPTKPAGRSGNRRKK